MSRVSHKLGNQNSNQSVVLRTAVMAATLFNSCHDVRPIFMACKNFTNSLLILKQHSVRKDTSPYFKFLINFKFYTHRKFSVLFWWSDRRATWWTVSLAGFSRYVRYIISALWFSGNIQISAFSLKRKNVSLVTLPRFWDSFRWFSCRVSRISSRILRVFERISRTGRTWNLAWILEIRPELLEIRPENFRNPTCNHWDPWNPT